MVKTIISMPSFDISERKAFVPPLTTEITATTEAMPAAAVRHRSVAWSGLRLSEAAAIRMCSAMVKNVLHHPVFAGKIVNYGV
jgi:KaiC/GvpD/RAD55 family RecA-like ATPase